MLSFNRNKINTSVCCCPTNATILRHQYFIYFIFQPVEVVQQYQYLVEKFQASSTAISHQTLITVCYETLCGSCSTTPQVCGTSVESPSPKYLNCLEMVQKFALRICSKDLSKSAGFPSLQNWRLLLCLSVLLPDLCISQVRVSLHPPWHLPTVQLTGFLQLIPMAFNFLCNFCVYVQTCHITSLYVLVINIDTWVTSKQYQLCYLVYPCILQQKNASYRAQHARHNRHSMQLRDALMTR